MSILHRPINSTQLFKGGLPNVTLQGTPKLPVGQRKPCPSGRALSSRMGQLSCTTAGYLQKEAQTGRKLLSNTLSSTPGPTLGPASALTRGTSGNTRVLPRWWRGGKQGIVMKPCLLSLLSCAGSCPSTPTNPGGNSWGRRAFPPPAERNWGRGRGEWREQNSEEKLCLGKAVALIQNDPFKGPREAALGSQVLSRPRHAPCV